MEQFYLENTIFNVDTEGRQRNRGGGSDLDPGGKFHPVFGVCIVWIEWKCVDKSY